MKLRRDWGKQNMVGLTSGSPFTGQNTTLVKQAKQRLRNKIEHFIATAVYPQQLTVPRQYATTEEGVKIFRILSGREINGVRENGVRVIVLENEQQARFIVSPLFDSEHDARSWAHKHMGA